MNTDGHYLGDHEYRVDAPSWVPYCTCGWTADETHDVRAYDEHIVAVVLGHERPRIEAEVRESIATEIEGKKQNGPFAAPYNTALVIAADIAWGKGQT